MRLLFLGDMVGRSGRTAVWERLPGLISDFRLDFVIVNGENAAGGFGITEDIYLATLEAGGRSEELPSEEEFEQTLGYMERFFRRFMGIVEEFDREEKTTQPVPPADRT